MKFKIIGIGNRNLLKNKGTLKYNYKNSGHISMILVLFLAGKLHLFDLAIGKKIFEISPYPLNHMEVDICYITQYTLQLSKLLISLFINILNRHLAMTQKCFLHCFC